MKVERIVDGHGMEGLRVWHSDTEVHDVPLAAIASWGELLGLNDEEALSAILNHEEPEPQTDDPDDQGWLGPYQALAETVTTEAVVEAASEGHVGLDAIPEDQAQTLSLMGQFGPDLVVAQTQALQENVQRGARARMKRPALPKQAKQAVKGIGQRVSEERNGFRQQFDPRQGR